MKFWDLKKQDERNELYLYGEIAGTKDWGDEFTPQDLKEALDGLNGAELSIYINSGGGEVFAGQAIYTMLKRYAGRKTVYIDGIAASIASVIAMAGDRVIMPENAMMMIHKAWTLAIGNADDLAKMAAEMTKLDGVIAGVYAAKTGRDAGEILGAMAEETWFTAAEALEYGLCDEIEAGKAVAASIAGDVLTVNGLAVDVSRYRHPPRAAVQSVEIVYGAPCSGKSTYVREHAGEDDLYYDYDALVRAMTTEDKRGTEKTVAHEIAIGVRGLMINKLAAEENKVRRAFIITRWPTDNLREQLAGMDVTEHRMDTSREECLKRLETDDTRTDKAAWAEIINKWFDAHAVPDEPDNGAETQPVEDIKDALEEQRRHFDALRRKIIITA